MIKFTKQRLSHEESEAAKERKAFYNSSKWRKLRDNHLKRFPVCAVCSELANSVHHVIDRLKDPSKALDRTNLQSLCQKCHSKETKARQDGNTEEKKEESK